MTRKFVTSLLLVFVMVFSIASCKKDKDDVEQQQDTDLAEGAKGTYEVYYIKDNTGEYTLPKDAVSATMYVNKAEENVVKMRLTLRDGNSGESKDADFGTVQLKAENNATAMYSGSDKIGTIDGEELEINVSDQGEQYIIKAKK